MGCRAARVFSGPVDAVLRGGTVSCSHHAGIPELFVSTLAPGLHIILVATSSNAMLCGSFGSQ